jgi:hypothetical protein
VCSVEEAFENVFESLLRVSTSLVACGNSANWGASQEQPRDLSACLLPVSCRDFNGCEECYVPLLVTTEPLEQAAKGKDPESCVLIITYERDSVWHNDGMVSVAPRDIEIAPRIVQVRGRKYRYQEISSSEAIKLFENPMGTIPISRPMLPKAASSGPTLEDLISEFRDPN